MTIKFDEMEVSVMPNFKGGEKEFSANMFFDGTNRIFKGRLIPGSSIGIHTHDDSCEVIFILEGNGTLLETDADSGIETLTAVSAGQCLYCQKGHTHSLRNFSDVQDLVFYAVVAHQ
jgi:mannose-6-phosphate isomerase-like protein (cupin superfamily)